MRELKILAVVVFFTLVVYWGVEPYAHAVMHKHVEGNNFTYSDLESTDKVGDPAKGQQTIMMAGCTGCHSIESQGIPAQMDATMAAGAYGVNPPDLSTAGLIYDDKFLSALIKNPTKALKVEHKFDPAKGKMHPMPAFYGLGGDIDQEVADIVAYLKSIAPEQITPEKAYQDACGRCHDMRYKDMTVLGKLPEFENDQAKYKFKINEAEYKEKLKKYMGKTPPDLSMMYGSRRGAGYISTFVENPQAWLEGTSMPRVGITKETTDLVMAYMEESADPAKEQRNALGPWVIGFFVIFTIISYFWKKSMWRDHH